MWLLNVIVIGFESPEVLVMLVMVLSCISISFWLARCEGEDPQIPNLEETGATYMCYERSISISSLCKLA